MFREMYASCVITPPSPFQIGSADLAEIKPVKMSNKDDSRVTLCATF